MLPNGTYVQELNQDKQNDNDQQNNKLNLFNDIQRGTHIFKDKKQLDLSDIIVEDKPKQDVE